MLCAVKIKRKSDQIKKQKLLKKESIKKLLPKDVNAPRANAFVCIVFASVLGIFVANHVIAKAVSTQKIINNSLKM